MEPLRLKKGQRCGEICILGRFLRLQRGSGRQEAVGVQGAGSGGDKKATKLLLVFKQLVLNPILLILSLHLLG